jgi:hypothetical protein
MRDPIVIRLADAGLIQAFRQHEQRPSARGEDCEIPVRPPREDRATA